MGYLMPKRIIAIIQARMGSTRLPGKVLLPIMNKPLLGHIVDRMSAVKLIDKVVVATSNKKNDDKIAQFCSQTSIPVFRGSELDVLDRMYQAARSNQADVVIRVTGDCPLLDPDVVTCLIKYYFEMQFDHCGVAAGAGVASDNQINRFPDGLDAEIFSMEVFTQAWEESTSLLHREHVTPFIWQQTERFNTGALVNPLGDFGQYRWTLDNKEDYNLIRWIYNELEPIKGPRFGMEDVLRLLAQYPEKMRENQHLIGKEGYEQFWK
jgi:spore coat polysaccharide biosynthesis protein SpsF